MKSICVFCGSSMGYHPIYEKSAYDLGRHIANENIRLVYGGGSIGLMGVMADAAMKHGGEVIGIIPRFLYEKEVGNDSVSELIIVESMHERKHKMAELSQGFIAMPGGIGTMEELFEIFTWSQLALIKKPVALLNVNKYYAHIISFLQNMVSEGFLLESNLRSLIISDNIHMLVAKMMAYNYAETPKWIDKT
jgi:uncharacterized protein (TIGR00730 family)